MKLLIFFFCSRYSLVHFFFLLLLLCYFIRFAFECVCVWLTEIISHIILIENQFFLLAFSIFLLYYRLITRLLLHSLFLFLSLSLFIYSILYSENIYIESE